LLPEPPQATGYRLVSFSNVWSPEATVRM
jgi:hypothetical protein